MEREELLKLVLELQSNPVLLVCILPDGREATVYRRLFNTIITVGPQGELTYDDQW